jgi:hypothetical protein
MIEISDPANPREVGVHDLDGSAQGLVLRGSHALVAVGWDDRVRIPELLTYRGVKMSGFSLMNRIGSHNEGVGMSLGSRCLIG